ncbi:2-amino-4-hydroxy-6-hydroxymethyldihydropteridine diphosphokinase [Planctomicrobium sp. SH661]|uniref:2-amino-4-hydroxy-6- hydroxymethyldihydropteridine diphosphokinase n=1 Tax=Planctomicrobium sp. SH661 TaxID=3448124 RepID=UPI003F5C3F64
MPGTDRHLVWITLGSNISPEVSLPAAVDALKAIGDVVKGSRVWQSAPVGDLNQADFCNAAVQVRTELSPWDLKQQLRVIEDRLGRVRDPKNKNAPRTIDLDIAFYDDLICRTDRQVIPDPDIIHRNFLAVPLAELDPDFHHPQRGLRLQEIAAASGGTANLQLRDDLSLV